MVPGIVRFRETTKGIGGIQVRGYKQMMPTIKGECSRQIRQMTIDPFTARPV